MNSSLHMEQVFEAFDQWERTQRCIRGHVRIVREDVDAIGEQLEALRDVLAEADDQLALENEKHPNHNITLVRQRIATVLGPS